MKYKVGDKFVWKEDRCCIDFYKNDEYELRYDEKNNTYSLATVYSDCGDYDEFQVNKTYEEICDIIDRALDSIYLLAMSCARFLYFSISLCIGYVAISPSYVGHKSCSFSHM